MRWQQRHQIQTFALGSLPGGSFRLYLFESIPRQRDFTLLIEAQSGAKNVDSDVSTAAA